MDVNTSVPSRSSAAYGYSCSNCAQSKRKCIVRAAGEPCQRYITLVHLDCRSVETDRTRCHKINKECIPAKTVRRSGVRKSGTSHATRLEKMKSGGQNSGTISQVINATETRSAVDSNQNSGMSLDSEESFVLNSLHKNQTNASTPATTDSMSLFGIADMSSHESEKCLDDFRVFKLQYFPFVHIPIDMTSVQLQKERPFLWLCIMSISTKSTARQKALGYQVRQSVAQIMLLESEKSIDLLLGLLTFLGW